MWESTAINAAGGAYIGAVVGLITADPTALLTIKSVSLTAGLGISLNALKGTIQGIVDINQTEVQNGDENNEKTSKTDKSSNSQQNGSTSENNSSQNDQKKFE